MVCDCSDYKRVVIAEVICLRIVLAERGGEVVSQTGSFKTSTVKRGTKPSGAASNGGIKTDASKQARQNRRVKTDALKRTRQNGGVKMGASKRGRQAGALDGVRDNLIILVGLHV